MNNVHKKVSNTKKSEKLKKEEEEKVKRVEEDTDMIYFHLTIEKYKFNH